MITIDFPLKDALAFVEVDTFEKAMAVIRKCWPDAVADDGWQLCSDALFDACPTWEGATRHVYLSEQDKLTDDLGDNRCATLLIFDNVRPGPEDRAFVGNVEIGMA